MEIHERSHSSHPLIKGQQNKQKKRPPKSNPADQTDKPEQLSPTIPQSPPGALPVKSTQNSSAPNPEPEKNWWDKVWTDPIATFAGAVALFPLAFVIVAGGQSRQLRRNVDVLAQIESDHICGSKKSLSHDIRNNAPTIRPKIGWSIKNGGRTPARPQRIRVKIKVGARMRSIWPNLWTGDDLGNQIMIPPDQSIFIQEAWVSPKSFQKEFIERILRNELPFFVYGFIEYKGLTKRTHRSGFAFQYVFGPTEADDKDHPRWRPFLLETHLKLPRVNHCAALSEPAVEAMIAPNCTNYPTNLPCGPETFGIIMCCRTTIRLRQAR